MPETKAFLGVWKDAISILEAIKTNRLLSGTQKDRSAMVIPEQAEYKLVYLSRLFNLVNTASYKTFDEVTRRGNFIKSMSD